MKESVWEGVVPLSDGFVVLKGETLVIRPGTRILAQEGSFLRVEGALSARAAAGSEISFIPEGFWGGLTLREEGRAVLSWTRVRGAENALRCEDAASAELSHAEILEAKYVGILAKGRSRVLIEDSLIALGETGVTLHDQAQARLRRCRLAINQFCGINSMMQSRVLAEDCRFEGNHTAVSLRDRGRADVRGSILRRNHVGVHAQHDSAVNVLGNRFEENHQEIDLLDSAGVSAKTETTLQFEPS